MRICGRGTAQKFKNFFWRGSISTESIEFTECQFVVGNVLLVFELCG